jgi:GNAT superfamily N-acetyltransferase
MTAIVTEVAHDDDAGMAELLAVTAAHGTPRATEPDAYRELMASVEAWRCVVVRDDAGELAAVALASIAAAIGLDQVQLNAFLAPGEDEAFAAVLDDIAAWGASRDAVAMTAHVSEPSDEDLAAWERAGFANVGERSRIARAVTAADAELQPVELDGVEVLALAEHPELENDAERLWRDGHGDVPSALRFDAADVPTMRSEMGLAPQAPMSPLVLVARAEGATAGLALLVRSTTDPGVAGHRFTTVDRDWRGRGIARALKVELLRVAAREGLSRVQASNDDGNAPMRAINDSLGYRTEYRIVLLRRAIAA